MKRLLRHMKPPEVRASTHSALTTSAALPTSGFTFVENSQGASAAVAELSSSIDVALEQLELEGDLSEQLRRQLERLDNEAAKYSNSRLSESAEFEDLACSQEEAQVVAIAWECAARAYDPSSVSTHEHYVFQREVVVAPSVGGVRKAATFITVTERSTSNLEQPSNSFLPLLVLGLLIGTLYRSVEAHSGFLSGAEELEPLISKYLQSAGQGNIKHVLFTGHSAGGAVASLLFLKYLSRRDEDTSIRFSCITFGSPPVMRPPLPLPDLRLHAGDGLLLNIINEFDLVTRSDSPYVWSLVNLYRSIYHLPPMQAVDSIEVDALGDAKAAPNAHTNKVDDGIGDFWALPSAFYHHVGERVVLHLRILGGDGDEDGEDLQNILKLRAVIVPGEEYERLLFCRIAVHSRRCYGERVKMLVEGWLSTGPKP